MVEQLLAESGRIPFLDLQRLYCYGEADRTKQTRVIDVIIGKGFASLGGQDSSNRDGISNSAVICEQRLIDLSMFFASMPLPLNRAAL